MIVVFGAVDRPFLIEKLNKFEIKTIMNSFDRPLSSRGWEIAREYGMDIWIDSGAFSAWKKGKLVDIDEYAAYIRRFKPEVYFNLDVVGDLEKTQQNQRYLENVGLNPVPVYHLGEPMEVLDDLAKRYQLIGLGGHVGKNPREWFGECFMRYRVQFHGLGVTRSIITEFPFYSVDSAWWQAPITTGGGENKNNEQSRRITKLKSMQYRGYAKYQERLF